MCCNHVDPRYAGVVFRDGQTIEERQFVERLWSAYYNAPSRGLGRFVCDSGRGCDFGCDRRACECVGGSRCERCSLERGGGTFRRVCDVREFVEDGRGAGHGRVDGSVGGVVRSGECKGVGGLGTCDVQGASGVRGVGVEGSCASGVDGCGGGSGVKGPASVESVDAGVVPSVRESGDGLVTDGSCVAPSDCVSGESKYDRNRRWAAERKDRKIRKKKNQSGGSVPEWRRRASAGGEGLKIGQVVAGCVAAEDVDGELKDSVKRKWKAKNELEIAKAQRELEVLKGNSVEDEVRSRQVGTRAAIERSMVSIERTHAQLRKADCVVRSDDDVVSGTVETLVSGVSSGTISPNSSVSEAEVRKLQKDFADGQAENERLRSALSRVGLDLAMVDAMDKKEWTVDHTGHVSEEVEDVFDRLYPRGTAYPDDPHMCDDGKLRRTIIGF